MALSQTTKSNNLGKGELPLYRQPSAVELSVERIIQELFKSPELSSFSKSSTRFVNYHQLDDPPSALAPHVPILTFVLSPHDFVKPKPDLEASTKP